MKMNELKPNPLKSLSPIITVPVSSLYIILHLDPIRCLALWGYQGVRPKRTKDLQELNSSISSS